MLRRFLMKSTVSYKMLLIVCFLVIVNLSYFNLQASTSYVKVVLKNGEAKKLEYNSFTFNWILPIRLTRMETCDVFELNKDEFDEIYIVDELYNECGKKHDWEVNVILKNDDSILGFFDVSEYRITGRLFDTG